MSGMNLTDSVLIFDSQEDIVQVEEVEEDDNSDNN
jgi:hypothetical protein